MNKEKMNQMIGEAYENYCKNADEGTFSRKWLKLEESVDGFFTNEEYSLYTQEEFINKCKTDPEFSEKWGLKIEERELSYAERYDMHINYINESNLDLLFELADDENLNRLGVPTKLITITYNNETIESYE